MNICIVSAFRNMNGEPIRRYFDQVERLVERRSGDAIRVSVIEGDSIDSTYMQLLVEVDARGFDIEITNFDHGGPHFGSCEDPERMRLLTLVGNQMLQTIRSSDDVVVYVESDLIWDPITISRLIDELFVQEDFQIIAPLIFRGQAFYDTYCFRINDQKFFSHPPYHPHLKPMGLTEVDCAGSCLVMKAEVARRVRMPNGEVLIGFCREARRNGFRCAVNVDYVVKHP